MIRTALRAWLFVLMAGAVWLYLVRGTAILFDLQNWIACL